MKDYRDAYFDEYMDSIFAASNKLTKEELERSMSMYEKWYGKYLPASKDASIIDIGSGAGHFLYFLGKNGYRNFLGIDISPQQIDFCKKHVSDKVLLCDAFEYLEGKRCCFDVVCLNDIIEHIYKEKVLDFLTLVKQSLNKGGVLLVKTPNLGNPFSTYLRHKDFTHEIGFTEVSLRQVLWLAGFRDINIFGPERSCTKSFRDRLRRGATLFIRFMITKLYQHQDYSVPSILTPLLVGVAVNK